MVRCLAILMVLLVLGVFSSSVAAEEPSAEDLQRDLALEAWLVSESTVVPGEPVRLGARLENRSATRTYTVVRPGDGSECGWREPHVFFTAVVTSARGIAQPVATRELARCGNYDADWRKGVIELRPGASLELTPHLAPVDAFLDFQREGSARIRLHYVWSRGLARRGGAADESPEDLGAMEGTPAFELVSDPVDLHVVRPIDVALETIAPLPVGVARTLDELVRVTVHNRTDADVDFRAQQLQFVIGRTEPPDLLDLREEVSPKARVRAAPLRAGEKRLYAGAANFQLLRHLRLRARRAGTIQLAVVYAPGSTQRGPRRSPVRVRSPWVTIEAVAD